MKEEIIELLTTNYKLKDEENNILNQILKNDFDFERAIFVLKELISLRLDLDSCLAYLLNQLSYKELKNAEKIVEHVEKDIQEMYNALKSLKGIYTVTRSEEAEDLRKMFLAMSKDLRVILIKLSMIKYDLINLKTPLGIEEENFVSEVKEIFAPLAERLGLNVLKSELEDLCLKFQESIIYHELEENVMLKKDENNKQIEITRQKLQQILDELNIEGEITFRQKHFSSVYKKMKTKNVTLAQIYDLIAMRVLVNTVEDCYAILGRIHAIYKPIAGRLKDYIASPKPNGYKSLHTTIVAENSRPLEIQIRTYEMHKISEYGVAAHWIYKEKRAKKTSLDEKLGWVREIMEGAKNLSSEEFIETLKTNLYGGIIFVQTPRGKVIEFPEGATPIDFAYAIHSDIGNSCVGAKVNSKMVPLTTKLNNGDIVEILTNPNSSGPSRDWLKNVKTTSARSKINAFFKRELKDENIKNGKAMFEQILKSRNQSSSQLLTNKYINELLYKYSMSSMDELYAAIGFGSLAASQVLSKLLNLYQRDHIKENISPNIAKDSSIVVKRNKDGILIDGDSGMLIRYAGCCSPVLGDGIVGYISRGRGVTIHRDSCANLKYLEPERLIKASWEDKSNKDFIAGLKIISALSSDILSRMTLMLADLKVILKAFEAKEKQDSIHITIKVQVKDNEALNKIMEKLQNQKDVIKVYRSE